MYTRSLLKDILLPVSCKYLPTKQVQIFAVILSINLRNGYSHSTFPSELKFNYISTVIVNRYRKRFRFCESVNKDFVVLLAQI